MPYKVNDPVGGQRPVVDDEQLRRMMSSNRPDFLQRNRFRLVTLALIAVNVLAFAAEVLLSGMRFDVPTPGAGGHGSHVRAARAGRRAVAARSPPCSCTWTSCTWPSTWWRSTAWARCWSACSDAATSCFCTSSAASPAMPCRIAADVLLGGGPTVSAGASTSVFGLFVAVALLGVLHKGNRRMFAEYSKGMLGIIGVNVVIHAAGAEHLRERALWAARSAASSPCSWSRRRTCACRTPCASSWRWHGWRRFCC